VGSSRVRWSPLSISATPKSPHDRVGRPSAAAMLFYDAVQTHTVSISYPKTNAKGFRKKVEIHEIVKYDTF
jgi:hypothetical protein